MEKNPTSFKHCSGCSSLPQHPRRRSPTEGPPKPERCSGEGLGGARREGNACRDGVAQHMLELNMALLPAGEERATRCKDKWEARAQRATGVLANARLLCLIAPHKTTSPFSW